jgi:hypothetical protein
MPPRISSTQVKRIRVLGQQYTIRQVQDIVQMYPSLVKSILQNKWLEDTSYDGARHVMRDYLTSVEVQDLRNAVQGIPQHQYETVLGLSKSAENKIYIDEAYLLGGSVTLNVAEVENLRSIIRGHFNET